MGTRAKPRPSSTGDGALEALRAVYAEVDALTQGLTCDASTDCCRFGVTGREPYPTALELALLERAVRARGGLPRRRTLPLAGERRCDLLSDEGRCLVYAARPFGCRTFFCERARGPAGERPRDLDRAAVAELARRVAELSARAFPREGGPRPLSRATASWESRKRVR